MNDSCIRLEILGQVYYLRPDDPNIDAEAVAAYVTQKVKEGEELYKDLPVHKAMVLTMMDIARDYVQVKQRLDALEKDLEKLVHKIDIVVHPDSCFIHDLDT